MREFPGLVLKEGGARPEAQVPENGLKPRQGERIVCDCDRLVCGWIFSSKDPPIARPPCHRSPDEALYEVRQTDAPPASASRQSLPDDTSPDAGDERRCALLALEDQGSPFGRRTRDRDAIEGST